MSYKPRILLVPDMGWWVIGEMGKQIVSCFRDEYDLYLMPATLLARRPDLIQELVPAVDAIHCISYETVELFGNYDPRKLPPIATWIHHVTTWNPVQQLAVEMSSAVTTCTNEWKHYIDERIGGRIPVTVVPHGVDTEFFCPTVVKPGSFGIPPDRFVVGFLGSKGSDLDYGRKGTGTLLDVIRKAAACIPNLHVVMGGPGWEKEATDLRALGVSVNSTGFVRKADLPALYSALDVYLLTSRVEGGPCTVFESMACETAVVSTRVGAVPELIVDGVNGWSADVDDSEGLLAAIVKLAHFPDSRTAIRKRARSTVLERSWAVALSPLKGVYDNLIQQRQTMGSRAPGPSWMNEPGGLSRASCAADALLTVYTRVRKGSMNLTKGVRMLHEMLNDQPIVDIVKGAAMIRRYRPELFVRGGAKQSLGH